MTVKRSRWVHRTHTFAQQPSEFDPRKALTAAKNAARGIVKARFEAFGCAGHASKIKPVPLEAMARRYA